MSEVQYVAGCKRLCSFEYSVVESVIGLNYWQFHVVQLDGVV